MGGSPIAVRALKTLDGSRKRMRKQRKKEREEAMNIEEK
jgi:hypothetical protein